MDARDKVIVMLDGNTDMKGGHLSNFLASLHLREAIPHKSGNLGPSTFRRNNTRTPIDGIWTLPDLNIIQGGYFRYDDLIPNTDHRCLWVDLSFSEAFGHNMPLLARPHTRRLHCRDPRFVKNYISRFKKLAKKAGLLDKVVALDCQAQYPYLTKLAYTYELLDAIRCKITTSAEKKCRKLKKGQVAFLPILQTAMRQIKCYSLLIKKKQGQKESSRLLARIMPLSANPTSTI